MPISETSSMSNVSRLKGERERQRRRSIRSASQAIKKTLGELPSGMRKEAGTSTRPTLRVTEEGWAWASHPSITFAVDRGGRLKTTNVLGTARHEVAHHLGASHTAMMAAGAYGGLSRLQVRQSARAQKEPASRRLTRARRFLYMEKVKSTVPSSTKPPNLKEFAEKDPFSYGMYKRRTSANPQRREEYRQMHRKLTALAKKYNLDY